MSKGDGNFCKQTCQSVGLTKDRILEPCNNARIVRETKPKKTGETCKKTYGDEWRKVTGSGRTTELESPDDLVSVGDFCPESFEGSNK